jgi:murein DD-endopeptidase MepM/ murein hydrolase activator NlpD
MKDPVKKSRIEAKDSDPTPTKDESNPQHPFEAETLQPEPGWADNPKVKTALNITSAVLLVILVILIGKVVQNKMSRPSSSISIVSANGLEDGSRKSLSVSLPPFATPSGAEDGITRLINLKTNIPQRARIDITHYTVQQGDNLFTIAEKYNLKPETLLWGNYELLKDNPEVLQPNQVLNVLPVDGTYYQWQKGDSISTVAAFFKAKPEDILGYPGNHIDLTTTITGTNVIEPGKWVIVPGGKRPFKDWGPPAITRTNPAVARFYGPGSCGAVYEGAVGAGIFVWPTTEHFLSGYTYTGIHPGIDIAGSLGNAVYAADSGVVVYSGWSNYGYGNLLVIDHGNGWQTVYAHLNSIGVSCGQSVSRGIMMAALGTTGNSSGPHLHFEMIYNGVKVNPLDYVK